MRKLLLLLTALASIFSVNPLLVSAENGRVAECKRLLEDNEYRKTEALLDEWKKAGPEDAEYYICASNYYRAEANLKKTQTENITNSPDSSAKAGDPVSPAPDSEKMTKAISILKEGIKKNPGRLDMRFGLADLCQEKKDFQCQYETIRNALKLVKENKDNVLGGENKPLSEPPEKYVSGKIHESSSSYSALKTPEGDENSLKLAMTGLEYYPENGSLLNDAGSYYKGKGDWSKALGYFLKSSKGNPEDSKTLFSIAECYAKLKEYKKALGFLKKIISLNNDLKMVAAAKTMSTEIAGALLKSL